MFCGRYFGTFIPASTRAREGNGPTLLECVTYRIRGHARFEAAEYRDTSEVEIWKRQDPIVRLRTAMLEARLASAAELDSIQAGVEEEIREAIAFAEASEDVEADEFWPYVTAEGDNA